MFKSSPPTTSAPTREEVRMAIEDQVIERKLTRLRLAGPELSHSRRNNLEAVNKLTNVDPYATFGIRRVIDSVNSIAFLSDTCAALHTHDSRPMEIMLDEADRTPDLVVADHGFAGEAINRDIPTVAVMDTNDPGLAVAKHLGANVILVPMNDNRPNVVTREAAELVKQMALESRHAHR